MRIGCDKSVPVRWKDLLEGYSSQAEAFAEPEPENRKKDDGVVVVVQMKIDWEEEEAHTGVDQPVLLEKETEYRREEEQQEHGDNNGVEKAHEHMVC